MHSWPYLALLFNAMVWGLAWWPFQTMRAAGLAAPWATGMIYSVLALGTILFNGLLVVGFAQVVWFVLARSLPPVASTLSVMFIPVLGVFSGAWWLGEVLHWQDWTAVGLMVLAIASVLWPARKAG